MYNLPTTSCKKKSLTTKETTNPNFLSDLFTIYLLFFSSDNIKFTPEPHGKMKSWKNEMLSNDDFPSSSKVLLVSLTYF
jgi:hypothetical protein